MIGRRSLIGALLGAVAWSAVAAPPPDPSGAWSGYTVETVRRAVPPGRSGNDVEVVPLRHLYTFPTVNYFELRDGLRRRDPGAEPQVLLVANGTYDLATLAAQVDDPAILERGTDGTYTSRLPIYVAPTATLVIEGVELRLSVPDVAAVIYRGDLFVVDARVTSWDPATGDYGRRAELGKDEVLLYGRQAPRPYLLGLRGSRSYFANSEFHGLGYQGRSSSFGISLAARLSPEAQRDDNTLRKTIANLPRPTGVLIGNTISRAFFGFFTNNSGPVLLLGNVFRDNIIYNVDPHDFSDGLTIVRNITVGARFKHGIILSREVQGALIAENVSTLNHGSGVMLDRDSGNATIRDNLVFANYGDGIAVFESDSDRLYRNLVFANDNDGVYIRNSRHVRVEGNTIDGNGHYGVEVATADLTADQGRDFALDPYTQAAGAEIVDNTIRNNLGAAIATKGADTLLVHGNDLQGSAPLFFAGDLEKIAGEVLEGNLGDGFRLPAAAGEDNR